MRTWTGESTCELAVSSFLPLPLFSQPAAQHLQHTFLGHMEDPQVTEATGSDITCQHHSVSHEISDHKPAYKVSHFIHIYCRTVFISVSLSVYILFYFICMFIISLTKFGGISIFTGFQLWSTSLQSFT